MMAQNATPSSSNATNPLAAQATNPPAAKNSPRRAANRNERMVQRLTSRLNLTPTQQNKVKAIFRASRAEHRTLAPQLREERMALKAAVKSDAPATIDQVLQQNAQLNSQAEAIHVKAMAKVYALLTPAQQSTFDQMSANRLTSHVYHTGVRHNPPAHS